MISCTAASMRCDVSATTVRSNSPRTRSALMRSKTLPAVRLVEEAPAAIGRLVYDVLYLAQIETKVSPHVLLIEIDLPVHALDGGQVGSQQVQRASVASW